MSKKQIAKSVISTALLFCPVFSVSTFLLYFVIVKVGLDIVLIAGGFIILTSLSMWAGLRLMKNV